MTTVAVEENKRRHRCTLLCGARVETAFWAINIGFLLLALLGLVSPIYELKNYVWVGAGVLVLALIGLKNRRTAFIWPLLLVQVFALIACLVAVGILCYTAGDSYLQMDKSKMKFDQTMSVVRQQSSRQKFDYSPTSYRYNSYRPSYRDSSEEERSQQKNKTTAELTADHTKQLEQIVEVYNDYEWKSRRAFENMGVALIAESGLFVVFFVLAGYLWLTVRTYHFVSDKNSSSTASNAQLSTVLFGGRNASVMSQQQVEDAEAGVLEGKTEHHLPTTFVSFHPPSSVTIHKENPKQQGQEREEQQEEIATSAQQLQQQNPPPPAYSTATSAV